MESGTWDLILKLLASSQLIWFSQLPTREILFSFLLFLFLEVLFSYKHKSHRFYPCHTASLILNIWFRSSCGRHPFLESGSQCSSPSWISPESCAFGGSPFTSENLSFSTCKVGLALDLYSLLGSPVGTTKKGDIM